MEQAPKKPDVYALVTEKIIRQLEQKTVPWLKPWMDAGIPQNLVTRLPYRGINVWLLASMGYQHNVFLTWRQVKTLGGTVSKGEDGHLVVFWRKYLTKQGRENGEGVQTSKSVLRYYRVFNIAQCANIPAHFIPPPPNTDSSPIASCERIIGEMPNAPEIRHVQYEAFYHPVEDYINMPSAKTFKTAELYYSILHHELIHATGHQSRLNRKEVAEKSGFGTKDYSVEELTAEIGACFLNCLTGIGSGHFKQNVAYINGWLKALRNDRRMIMLASSQAQKAVDYITNNRKDAL